MMQFKDSPILGAGDSNAIGQTDKQISAGAG